MASEVPVAVSQGQAVHPSQDPSKIFWIQVLFADGQPACDETKIEVPASQGSVDDLKYIVASKLPQVVTCSPVVLRVAVDNETLPPRYDLVQNHAHLAGKTIHLVLPDADFHARSNIPAGLSDLMNMPSRIGSVGAAVDYGRKFIAAGVTTMSDAKNKGIMIKPKRLWRLVRWAKAFETDPTAFTEDVNKMPPASPKAMEVCDRLCPPDPKHNGHPNKKRKWENEGKVKRAPSKKRSTEPSVNPEAMAFLANIMNKSPPAWPNHYLSYSLDHKQFFYTHKGTGAVTWVSQIPANLMPGHHGMEDEHGQHPHMEHHHHHPDAEHVGGPDGVVGGAEPPAGDMVQIQPMAGLDSQAPPTAAVAVTDHQHHQHHHHEQLGHAASAGLPTSAESH